jgi:predicted ATPase
LQIGRLLRHKIPQEKCEEQIFEIVNPLNLAIDLITTVDEQIDLARLNLLAGRKAKDSTAYEAALKYFTLGRSLLSPECWTAQYELMLGLHINATEAAYLSKDFDQMEQLAEIVLQQAQTLLDGLQIYEIKIQAYQDQGNLAAGVATALNLLASLNVHLAHQPTPGYVWRKKKQMQWALARKPAHCLLNLPTMRDPNSLAAMQILAAVMPLVVFANPALGQLVVLQLLSLSLKAGNTAISAEGYTAYAVFLCDKASGIDLAYQFGQLALTQILHPS